MEKLEAPQATQEDLSLLDPVALAARGFTRLPQSLGEAIERMLANETVRGWFPAGFCEVYRDHKRGELKFLGDRSVLDQCKAYEAVY